MGKCFCHQCSVELGYLRQPPTGKVVGSSYQLEKYIKHTVPDSQTEIQSVFDTPSTQAYAEFLVGALSRKTPSRSF
jgi:hypothetical protein